MTKVKYIADSLKSGEWASWFPYWYSGSTVTQYYPPLSYWSMVVPQLVFDNVMVTFKIFIFTSQFTGALGVWYFCKRFTKSWAGVLAGSIYCAQPFLVRSLILSGVVAQGPIYALTPWLLVFTTSFFTNRTRFTWLGVSAVVFMLTLSHVMHVYMICICLGIAAVVMLVRDHIDIFDLLHWAVAVAVGVGLASGWWLPGVTRLENPSIPFLLPEAAEAYTATVGWYQLDARTSQGYYFSIYLSIVSIGAYVLSSEIRRNRVALPLLVSLIASLYLSFGAALPLFRLIPLWQSLVPGRILSFASLISAILPAYLMAEIGARRRMPYYILITALTFLMFADINPHAVTANYVNNYASIQEDVKTLSSTDRPFDQGRIIWISPTHSAITFFPMLMGLNTADGWNIEGTLHNRAIWQHNIAISIDQNEYVVRNLLRWNVRTAIISTSYPNLIECLKNYGFRIIGGDTERVLMKSDHPSSYLVRPTGTGVALGKAARTLVMHFPWLVEGHSTSLEAYKPEELESYKLIYIIEPDIANLSEFENQVRDLADSGKTVIIEWGRADAWPLLGTFPFWDRILPGSYLQPTDVHWSNSIALEPDPSGQATFIDDLSVVLFDAIAGDTRGSAIGYVQIGNGRVYFVGLSLGQTLHLSHGREVSAILEAIMSEAGVSKNIVPSAFSVTDAQWSSAGCTFKYEASEDKSVWISVTYSPRWKAFVDGHQIDVGRVDNLVHLDLPSGSHTVSLRYGSSWVSRAGLILSMLFFAGCVLGCVFGGRKKTDA